MPIAPFFYFNNVYEMFRYRPRIDNFFDPDDFDPIQKFIDYCDYKVVIVRDGKYAYSTAPNREEVDFSWRDNQPNRGKASYYYVRGEQDNGEIVWVSPLWITYTGN